MIDFSRCRTEPRQHQKEGVLWLTTDSDTASGRIIPCVYMLADEVGAGKSRQASSTWCSWMAPRSHAACGLIRPK